MRVIRESRPSPVELFSWGTISLTRLKRRYTVSALFLDST
jgi:hypothetical protein